MHKRALFFAKVQNPMVFERNEFYSVDIRILREIGYKVTLSNNLFHLPKADLYFIWWWTWALGPLLRAQLFGIPAIVAGVFDHFLPGGELERFDNRPKIHQWMMTKSLEIAKANIFCSALEYNGLTSRFKVRNPHYSHLCVDSRIYCPGPSRDDRLIVSICWMNAFNPVRKCLYEAIQAIAQIHEHYRKIRYVICGEKLEGFSSLSKLVSDLGAQEFISFPGYISREEKIQLLQRCAVYLQPTKLEGFGLAIAEAMACGAPVLTSAVGTVPEVCGDAAVFVDGTCPGAIADELKKLLEDSERRSDLGERGRSRIVELFSYGRRKMELSKIIDEVHASSR